jgi:hypothetical protein
MSAWRVESWSAGDPAPDLWEMLGGVVAREVRGAGDRVVIADSKELKRPNSSARVHPLTHLERGVLAVLGVLGERPADDGELARLLGSAWPDEPWYEAGTTSLPLAWDAGLCGIAASRLAGACERAGVRPLALACEIVGESRFNALVRAGGSKGASTLAGLRRHAGRVVELAGAYPDDDVRLVCDRLGGRERYADVVAELLGVPVDDVGVVEENAERSRYRVLLGGGAGGGSGRGIGVVFQCESERAHLPVALASMAAKLCRELAMARFNRYWGGRLADVKPTAGYWQDAKRWLKAAGDRVTASERKRLVRIA